MAQTIESVADLYAALGGADNLNWLITHDPQTQTWHGYFGDADRGTAADKVLTDQTGILADIKTPISVHLAGDALGESGMSAITLTLRSQPRRAAIARPKANPRQRPVHAPRDRRQQPCGHPHR